MTGKFLLLLMLVSLNAFAYEEPSFEDFINQKENIDQYNHLVALDAIKSARGKLGSMCKKWNADKENIDAACVCVAGELNKLSDEVLFYTSILAYQRYRAKVTALESDDKKTYEALKVQFKNSPLADKKIERKCHVQ